MLSYLQRCGDKPFTELPFNEIDNLILSQLSYCGYEKCVDMLPCPLKYLCGRPGYGVNPKNEELFTLACQSRRFGSCVVLAYHYEFSETDTKQFAAVTFLLEDGTAYAAFRGTDSTLVGWKEDFMLCFDSRVPAQALAVDYLERVSEMLSCPLRVGGHSKGGNLAVYASAFCNAETRACIKEVYSNDGPGFMTEILETKGYVMVKPLVRKFVPESSVIGRLLEDDIPAVIVESTGKGLWQHDPFTWKTEGTGFIAKGSNDTYSAVIQNSFRSWMEGMLPEKRRYMTDMLFSILGSGDDKTIRELRSNPKALVNIISAITKLEPEDRKNVMEIAGSLIKAAGDSSGKALRERVSDMADSVKKMIGREEDKHD